MRQHITRRLAILWLSASFVLFTAHSSAGVEPAPPHGVVVSSVLVDPDEYSPNGGRYDLFLQTVPGEKTSRLTDHQGNPKRKLGGAIGKPLFSNDGKRLVFLADFTASSKDKGLVWTGVSPNANALLNVWEVGVDTRKVSPITKGDFGWRLFGWSPDDGYVCAAYQSRLAGLDQDSPIPEDLYVWDMHTGKGRKLVRVSDAIRDAFWSHDGKNIHYQSWANTNLFSVPRQGGKPRILLQGKEGRYGYAFSPDGKRVAYVDTNTVYIAEANGGKPEPVIKMARNEQSPYSPVPRWSGDGGRLAIATYEPPDNASVSTKLHVYDLSKRMESVVAAFPRFVSDPIWSKDGQWLLVKIVKTGNTVTPDPKTGWHTFHRDGLLAVAVSDGRAVTLLEPNGETNGLDWFEGTR